MDVQKALEEKIEIAQNPDNITFKEKDEHRRIHSENGGTHVPIKAKALLLMAGALELLDYIPDPFEVQSLACSDMDCPKDQ